MDLNRTTSEFLGIPYTEDPRSILGVTTGRTDHIAINNALRRRLAQLHVHPSGNSADATEVKNHLNSIAKKLLLESPEIISESNTTGNELTSLDQAIIASLVCEGGWNKKSRSRLVGIAASYSITVGGLMRIMEAFSASARSGNKTISKKLKSAHTIDRSWADIPVKKSSFSIVDSFISDAAKKLTPDLKASNPVMTIKLAVLFSILTLIAFILSLRILLTDESTSTAQQPEEQTLSPSKTTSLPTSSQQMLFTTFPTFKVEGIDSSTLTFADKGVDQPKQLASIAQLIRDSLAKGKHPQPTVLREWNQAVDVLAFGWPFMETNNLRSSESQLFDVLLQAEMNESYVQTLLQSLEPPTIKLGSPSSVIRATWASGILASLSCDQRFSTEVRSFAKKAQMPSITACDSQQAKNEALILIADDLLLRSEFDDRSLQMWEAWIVAIQQFQKTSKIPEQEILLIKSILESDIDLLRESNTRNVLGRIVSSTDWTSSTTSRDEICALISSEDYDAVDVSLLTAIYHAANSISWFNDSFLIKQNDSIATRIEIAELLQSRWPVDRSESTKIWNLAIPTGFDIDVIEQWNTQIDDVLRQSAIDVEAFVKLRMLNEAAVSIWKGRPDLALHAIDNAKSFTIDSTTYFKPAHQEIDGTFTDLYLAAGKDEYEQLGVIDSLLNGGETDLGPRDADLLASIALANNKNRLRVEASRVIVEQFANGSTVAISLLNNFHKAKTKEQVITLIAGLTDVMLPEQDSIQWPIVARKAFVQHSLTAGNKLMWEFDEASSAISTSLLSEYLMLNPEHLPLNSEATPNDAIEMVVKSWNRAIPPKYHSSSQIEFTPTGVLQFYLLQQIKYFALLKAEESRWRSDQEPIISIHALIDRLHATSSIFEQLTVVETEITTHWQNLFSELIAEYLRRSTK